MAVPMVWTAPGRLSTTICCPICFASSVASMRDTISDEEPGAEERISLIGRSGYCAAATALQSRVPQTHAPSTRLNRRLPGFIPSVHDSTFHIARVFTRMSSGSGKLLAAVVLLQILVDESDRHAALPDRGSDTLYRAQPHIPARENPGDARFEKVGIAAVRPASGFYYIVTGEDIATGIARDVRWRPPGLRIGSDEDEQAAALVSAHFP